jgi:hypothetical protein
MTENFDLPITIGGNEIILPAQLHQYGYTYQVEVEINGNSIFFERDEERNWRAILNQSGSANLPSVKHELLQAISDALEKFF